MCYLSNVWDILRDGSRVRYLIIRSHMQSARLSIFTSLDRMLNVDTYLCIYAMRPALFSIYSPALFIHRSRNSIVLNISFSNAVFSYDLQDIDFIDRIGKLIEEYTHTIMFNYFIILYFLFFSINHRHIGYHRRRFFERSMRISSKRKNQILKNKIVILISNSKYAYNCADHN